MCVAIIYISESNTQLASKMIITIQVFTNWGGGGTAIYWRPDTKKTASDNSHETKKGGRRKLSSCTDSRDRAT